MIKLQNKAIRLINNNRIIIDLRTQARLLEISYSRLNHIYKKRTQPTQLEVDKLQNIYNVIKPLI